MHDPGYRDITQGEIRCYSVHDPHQVADAIEHMLAKYADIEQIVPQGGRDNTILLIGFQWFDAGL
jgi:hypothetical protein